MQRVGEVLRAEGVAAVFLAHGTFVGPDALGVLAELARVYPAAGQALRRLIKRIVDRIAGEAGNYTGRYARCFESAINPPGERRIPVWLFHWSSENTHIGRADGAVRLIDELLSLGIEPGQRVLLWGHSHAGNVFALMTNLLAGDREAAEDFFRATEIYYRWPVVGCVDIPVWNRVREALAADRSPLAGAALDMVTFGTPIRYGWDSAGYGRLLHFIHRRPARGVPPYRAPFPVDLRKLLHATEGDYVQQLGIAGTDVTPSVFAWRARLADQRLERLLHPDTPADDPQQRFQAGSIVPDEGTTLLVDYGPAEGGIAEHFAGHAVYTRPEWMLFHAEEVVRRLYGDDAGRAA
jgi:hypothetical protein